MEDRDVSQGCEVRLQSRGIKAENRRAAGEPARRALHPQLANLLDDHDQSRGAGCPTSAGIHQTGASTARCPVSDKLTDPRGNTLSAYLIKVARLGGYLARTNDSPPGNMVMWRGLSRLTDIELGVTISAQLVGN